MKKFSYLLICIIFCLFFVNDVSADSCSSSTDDKISYDIYNGVLNENNSSLELKGFSFIDHRDNFGGDNSFSYIVFSSESLEDVRGYVNGLENKENFVVKSGNYYVQSVKFNKAKSDAYDELASLYQHRCTGDACSKGKARYNNYLNGHVENGNSCLGSNNNFSGGSHCLYYNLFWHVNINLKAVVNHFIKNATVSGDDVKLSAYICSKTHDVIDCSGVGIYNRNVITNYKDKIVINSNGQQIAIKLDGISNKVKFTACSASKHTSSTSMNGNGGGMWTPNGTYYIKDIGFFNTYKNYWKSSDKFKYRQVGLASSSNGNIIGYALTSWFRPTGNTSFNISFPNCMWNSFNGSIDDVDNKCIGNDCSNSSKNNGNIPNNAGSNNVNETKVCSSSGDINTSIASNNGISKTYYYKVSYDFIESNFNNILVFKNNNENIKCSDGERVCYFPIKFTAYYKVNQTSSLTLNKNFNNKDLIKSGKSVLFSYDVKISASWEGNGGTYSNVKVKALANGMKVCKTSDGKVLDKIEDTSKSIVSSVDVDVALKDGAILYNKEGNNYNQIVYGNSLYNDILRNKLSSMRTSSDMNLVDIVYPEFKSSNDATDTVKVLGSDIGEIVNYSTNYTNGSSWNMGDVSTVSYTYNINKAYFSNNGNGFVSYKNVLDKFEVMDINDGSLYYVPFNLNDEYEFVNLSNVKLSIINDINVTYSTACTIKGEDEFTKKDSLIKYRPITVKSINDAFPNGYSYNWQLYFDDVNSFNRIANSYDKNNLVYVTKKIDKSSVIENVSNIKYEYNSYSDTAKNGTSIYIKDIIFDKIIKKHCKIGEFNKDCD